MALTLGILFIGVKQIADGLKSFNGIRSINLFAIWIQSLGGATG